MKKLLLLIMVITGIGLSQFGTGINIGFANKYLYSAINSGTLTTDSLLINYKLGINTTAPKSKLAVVSTIADSVFIGANGGTATTKQLAPAFNFTYANTNTSRDSLTASTDTSSFSLAFTPVTGKPILSLKGATGTTALLVDSTGAMTIPASLTINNAGGAILSDLVTSKSTNVALKVYPAGAFMGVQIGNKQTIMLTEEGGYAILVRNTSGSTIAKGTVLVVDTNTTQDTMHVKPAPTSSEVPQGVAYASITNGSYGYMVVSGYADVLIDNTYATYIGYFIAVSSATAGQAEYSNSTGTSTHNRELGHPLRPSSGAGALVRCNLHWQ